MNNKQKILLPSLTIILSLFMSFSYSQETEWFSSLEDAMKKPSEVKRLSLAQNGLNSFPLEILQFKNLESLILWENNIVEIPEEIGNLSKLKELNLANNRLKQLPKSIEKLSELEKLNLNVNSLESFPKTILKLRKLKDLIIGFNPIKEIPNEISELDKLVHLAIGGIGLREFPIQLLKLENLEELSINKNKIKTLPSDFTACLKKLDYLNLSDNLLSEWPERTELLVNLTSLHISDNNLTDLSKFCNFKSLKFLQGQNNNFSLSSPCLSELTKLEFVNLRLNNFSQEQKTLINKALKCENYL